MISHALPLAPVGRSILGELDARQRTLARYGMASLALAVTALLLQFADPRLLASGVNIWVKPAKFFLSVAVFSLTMAWFFGYVRPERRRSRAMRATVGLLIAAASFELFYIVLQALRGQESHFNIATPAHILMYALMGVGAVLLVATTLPLAWEIARRPAKGLAPDYAAAVVTGLVLTFLLGAGTGAYMSQNMSHSVGADGGRLFFFAWNRSGGDLRVAHFLGIHAQQAIPLLGFLVAPFAPRIRWAALIAGATGFTALTLALLAQAIAGRPLF